MGGSFDELLDHLLNEIGLRGNTGFSILDFKLVTVEYLSSTWNNFNVSASSNQALLDRVWGWLLSNDEVRIEPERLVQCSIAQAEELEANESRSVANESTMEPQSVKKAGRPIRLFVSEERTWQALTGHDPDWKLLPEKEYQLLQIISAAGKIGILQPELVAKSGQDNRSVPGRTDRLAQKGYIEKKSVFFGNERSFKTSWICHSRFKKSTADPKLSFLDHLGSQIEDYSRADEMRLEWIFDHVLRHIRSKEITVMDDMASSLGLRGNMRSERRMLDRVIDRLEIIGLVRRVKVPIEKEERGGPNFLKCLKLLREPTEEDVIRARNVTKKERYKFRRHNAMKKKAIKAGQLDSSEDDLDLEADDDLRLEASSIVETEFVTEQIEDNQCSLPIPIQWDPDEYYINQIWRVVNDSGTKGISTTEVRDKIYGPNLSKPVEHWLARLSEHWDKSQPPHLRHLSLVRDAMPCGRTVQYHYRTFDNFQTATENGEASWEAIGVDPLKLKKPDLDAWGFPKLPSSDFVKTPGSQLLQDCINTNNYQLLKISTGDPIVVTGENGQPQVKFESQRASSRSRLFSTVMTEDDIQAIKEKQDSSTAAEAPGMIRGIPKADYHRIYYKKWQQQQQERKRLPQVTRLATLIAKDEAINEFNTIASKDPKSVLIPDPFNHPLFQKSASLSAKEKTPNKKKRASKSTARSCAMSTRRGRHPNDQDMELQIPEVVTKDIHEDDDVHDLDLEEVEEVDLPVRKQPLFGFKRPILASQERIQELVPTLMDTSKPGLHVNANRPIFKWYRPKKESLLLTFKFERLRDFDWFNEVPEAAPLPATALNVDSPLQSQENNKYGVFRVKKKGRRKKGEENAPYLILKFVLPGLKKPIPVVAESDELEQSTSEPPILTPDSTPVSKRRLENFTLGDRPSKQRKVSFVPEITQVSASQALYESHGINNAVENISKSNSTPMEAEMVDAVSIQPGKEGDAMSIESPAHFTARSHPSIGSIDTENHSLRQTQSSLTDIRTSGSTLPMPPMPSFQADIFNANMSPIPEMTSSSFSGRKRGQNPPSTSSPSTKLGGVRFKRSQLIMSIMEKAGGVIGEEREIVRAYQIQNQRNGEPVSDKSTIQKAVKNLVDQGKLRRITFSFEHITRTDEKKTAKMVFKNLLITSGTSTNSDAVKDAIESIKRSHPTMYLPPGLQPPQTPEKLTGARYFAMDFTITSDHAKAIYQAPRALPSLPPHVQAFHARQKEIARMRQEVIDRAAGPKPPPKKPGPKRKRLSYTFVPDTAKEELLQSYHQAKVPGMRVMSKNDMKTRLSIQWPSDIYFMPWNPTYDGMSDVEVEPLSKRRRLQEDENVTETPVEDWQSFRYEILPPSNTRMRRTRPVLGYTGSHLHHMLQLLYPIQTFHPPTGTFSTLMLSSSRWNESDPSRLELALEVNEWTRDGYSLRLVEDGQSGYVNYVIDHSKTHIPFERITTSIHPLAWNKRAIPAAKLNLKCVITPAAAKKLLYSCVAVRTLVGSIDQVVSWPVIDYIFRDYPNYTRHNFTTRWVWMNKHHKDVVSKLQKDFEGAFLRAYESGEFGEFPPTYSSRDIDWEKIINWAELTIDIESDRHVLPETRDLLNSYVEVVVKDRDVTTTRESIDIRSGTAVKKQMMEHQLDFTFSGRRKQPSHNDDLTLAKSWARAAITTKIKNARSVNEKLKMLDDALLRRAIDELVADEVFSPLRSKGDARHFQLSDKLETIVKSRPWNSLHYSSAVAFKKQLDNVFATKGAHIVTIDAADWEVMVVFEMYANGRVTVTAKLPPVNSNIGDPWPRLSVWGFAEGAYEAKKISRDHYSFEIEVRPTERYVKGLPLVMSLKKAPIPTKVVDDSLEKAKIPFWVDFEGNVNQPLWAKVLMVSLHAISLRAGITVERLRSTMRKFVEVWEMDLLVNWLRKTEIVEYVNSKDNSGGLIVKEWWWMAMGEEGIIV